MLGQIVDGKVRAALFALLSVAAGAMAYLSQSWADIASANPLTWPWFPFLALLFVALGLILPELSGMVLRRRPRLGLAMIEMRALWVLVVLATLTMGGLWLTELFAVDDATEANIKVTMEAVETAATAVLTALAVAIAGDSSASATAKTSRAKFQKAFEGHAKGRTGQDLEYARQVEQAVFSDPFAPPLSENRDRSKAVSAEGWDWDARWSRARTVAANLV